MSTSSVHKFLKEEAQLYLKRERAVIEKQRGRRNYITSRDAIFAAHEKLRIVTGGNEIANDFSRLMFPQAYPPANVSIPAEKMKKIHAKDLSIGIRHKDFHMKIWIRTNGTIVENSIQAVYEDEQGSFGMIRIYFGDSRMSPEDHLGEGQILAIRDPLLWNYSLEASILRVDHPSDVEYLCEWEESKVNLLPDSWKLSELVDCLVPMDLIKRAQGFYQLREYHKCLVKYRQAEMAIKRARTKVPPSLLSEIELGRAKTQTKLDNFFQAALDIDSILKKSPGHREALYLRALRLYGIGRYDFCSEVLEDLLVGDPRNPKLLDLQARARERYDEMKFGNYNWKRMREGADIDAENFMPSDHADYTNAVKLKKTPKGRRIFTARDIKRGELIMVCKAIAVAPYNGDESRQVLILKDINVDTDFGSGLKISTQILERIKAENPGWYEKNLVFLESGDYNPQVIKFPDGNRVPDAFHVDNIRLQNRVVISNLPAHLSRTRFVLPINPQYDIEGVWLLPSHLRHECLPNAHRTVLGDMMIIRAGRDIPANTKVTIAMNTTSDLAYASMRFTCYCPVHEFDTKNINPTRGPVEALRKELWDAIDKQVKRIDDSRFASGEVLQRLNLMEVLAVIDYKLNELRELYKSPTALVNRELTFRLRYVAAGYMSIGQRRHARCSMYKVLDAHGVIYEVDEECDIVKFYNYGHPSEELLDSYHDLYKLAQTAGIRQDWYDACVEVYEIIYGERDSFTSVVRGVEFVEAKDQCGCVGIDNFFDVTEQELHKRMGFSEEAYKATTSTPDGHAMSEIINSATETAWTRTLAGHGLNFRRKVMQEQAERRQLEVLEHYFSKML